MTQQTVVRTTESYTVSMPVTSRYQCSYNTQQWLLKGYLWKAWLRIRTKKPPTYNSLVIINYGTAVYSPITHTNYELARAGGRVTGMRAMK